MDALGGILTECVVLLFVFNRKVRSDNYESVIQNFVNPYIPFPTEVNLKNEGNSACSNPTCVVLVIGEVGSADITH